VTNGGHRRYSTVFLKKLFSRGKVYEELFNGVCKAGCDVELWAPFYVAFARSRLQTRKGS
jgi:hypothetical protein